MKNWGAWGKPQVRDLQQKRYPEEHMKEASRGENCPCPHWPGLKWTRLTKVRPEVILDLARATNAEDRQDEACPHEEDKAPSPGQRGRSRVVSRRALRLEAQEPMCVPVSTWRLET